MNIEDQKSAWRNRIEANFKARFTRNRTSRASVVAWPTTSHFSVCGFHLALILVSFWPCIHCCVFTFRQSFQLTCPMRLLLSVVVVAVNQLKTGLVASRQTHMSNVETLFKSGLTVVPSSSVSIEWTVLIQHKDVAGLRNHYHDNEGLATLVSDSLTSHQETVFQA